MGMSPVRGSGGNASVRAEARTLRAALRTRTAVLATFVLIPRVEIIELLAAAGFDAVILDLEHGHIATSELPALTAAAQGAGLHAIVRVAQHAASEIGLVLDAGADGLLIPHVASAHDAASVVAASRFPPLGTRSINPYVRGVGYIGDQDGGLDAANDRVAVVAMIEGIDALSQVEAICATPGLDGAFIGPVDLSASLELPGQADHPAVVAAATDVLGRIAAAGLSAGIYAPTPAAARRWRESGAALIALSADSAMALRGFSTEHTAARAEDVLAG